MNAVSVVLAGGGTAGHISPMLAIADAISRIEPEADIACIGTEQGLETRLVPAAGYTLHTIERVPLPRKPNAAMFSFPSRFRAAVAQAKQILTAKKADVVIGVGGYVCTPVYLAAKRLNIPVVLHEANARPGLANKLGARFAAFAGVAFENTPLRGATWVGMPMHTSISQLDRSAEQAAAREKLGLDTDRTTLVVTGGSSGALNLNNAVASAVPELLATGAQILHLTGHDKTVYDHTGQPLADDHYHQREYLDGMATAYAAADAIVARAGAATVCEVAAVGLPAVFVPLPVGNGEQELNAASLVEAGGAILVKDADFTSDWIQRNMVPLLKDPRRLLTMEEHSAQRGITDADERMARTALDHAAGGSP